MPEEKIYNGVAEHASQKLRRSPHTGRSRQQRGVFGKGKLFLLLTMLAVLMFSQAAWAQDEDDEGGSAEQGAGGQDPKKNEPPPNYEIDEVEEMDDDDFAELPLADHQKKLTRDIMLKTYGPGGTKAPLMVEIDSISPEGGPTTGETRVIVRGGPFKDMELIHPHPKCKFGRNDRIVQGTYVSCTEKPLAVHEDEGKKNNRGAVCIACDISPAVDKPQIVSLQVSVTGDFTDSNDSEPFRYYEPTRVNAIYPHYGPKDGHTHVQVWGENFLNFDENTRCNFGSKSVPVEFHSSTYLTCRAPQSDTVGFPIPFSISLNNQQSSRDFIYYYYYNNPTVAKLLPNYGPASGGNEVLVEGAGFDPFSELPSHFRQLHNFEEKNRMNKNDTFCEFDGVAKMPAKVIGANKLVCIAPASDIDMALLFVTLNNQDYSDDDVPYYWYKAPKLYDIQPDHGPTDGGTPTRIYGTDYKTDHQLTCLFGDEPNQQVVNATVITSSEIECITPPHISGKVPVRVSYRGDRGKSVSEPLYFTYVDRPRIISLDPPCGPVQGFTQIVVKGRNFVELGANSAFCIFNETHYMNTTVIDTETLLCSTPRLPERERSLPAKDLVYRVKVTMDKGESRTTEFTPFAYYFDSYLTHVEADKGPVTGNTTSHLTGKGFTHPNVCNFKVRYGALEVTPKVHNDTSIETISPEVNLPGAVVLATSGNGQNYADDITLHVRDLENTFTYYQEMFANYMHPQDGPTSGNTKVTVRALGLSQYKFANGTIDDSQQLYARLRHKTGPKHSDVEAIPDHHNDMFTYLTPPADDGTELILQTSWNGQNWQDIIPTGKDYSYLYYDAPEVTGINPHFGPVKSPNGEMVTISGKNFKCPNDDCSELRVRFGSPEFGTSMRGSLINENTIQCYVPKYTKPDVLPVEVSFNNFDFTSNGFTYGFFDAYLLNVQPRLVSHLGNTTLTLDGFGFVNAGDDQTETRFGTKNNGTLDCMPNCVQLATYVDKNTIRTKTLPQQNLFLSSSKKNIEQSPFTVEASVYNHEFTENNIEVWYIFDPWFKSVSRNQSPKNLALPVLVETEFYWDKNDYDRFTRYGNFTCRFTVGDQVYVTDARMETMPFGSRYDNDELPDGQKKLPTHVLCASPRVSKAGQGKLDISPNGQDYTGNFKYSFTDQVDVYRLSPACGPKDATTKVQFIGTGFKDNQEHLEAKTGVLETEDFLHREVKNINWNESTFLSQMLMTQGDMLQFRHVEHDLAEGDKLESVFIDIPKIPKVKQGFGGPNYVSMGEEVDFFFEESPTRRRLEGEDASAGDTASDSATAGKEEPKNIYADQKPVFPADEATQPAEKPASTEQPVEQVAPVEQAAPVASETPEEMSADKSEGAEPAVQIDAASSKDQEQKAPAQAEAPASKEPKKKVANPEGEKRPSYMFSNSNTEFLTYIQPVVKKVFPTMGLTKGGTPLELSGAWFDQQLEFDLIPYCKIGPKVVRAQFISTVRIVCMTPPNDDIVAPQKIYVSLNGANWVDTGFVFSYYVQPELIKMDPHYGPMQGGTEIMITGTAFSNITDHELVKCRFTLIDNKRNAPPKFIPARYIDRKTMMCASPPGFFGGESVNLQMTFNGMDFTEVSEKFVYNFYTILGSFPHSGPADAFDQVILVRGAGLKASDEVVCRLNNTDIAPVDVSPNLIQCPMCLPGKDPHKTGEVKFGVKIFGVYNDFGGFYYYEQIDMSDMTPHYGPAEGRGDIFFNGDKFRDDFPGAQLGCKVGDSVGQAVLIDSQTMKCVVEKIQLAKENEPWEVKIALNSYSWVGSQPAPMLFMPYGISEISPRSGPYDGFTDLFITGAGFTEDIAENARCRFGVDQDYSITEGHVLDFNRMVCRSPEQFKLPEFGSKQISVPFGIAFGDWEFHPWTIGAQRYLFYENPYLIEAIPNEVKIGKMAEIFVKTDPQRKFFDPVPYGPGGQIEPIMCDFEEFGHSMGMYVNDTFVMCVSPRISGHPEDYYRETVTVRVALNGQDFTDIESEAVVTFVGTGKAAGFIHFIIATLLIALLLIALAACTAAVFLSQQKRDKPHTYSQELREYNTYQMPRGSINSQGPSVGGIGGRGFSRQNQSRAGGLSRQSGRDRRNLPSPGPSPGGA